MRVTREYKVNVYDAERVVTELEAVEHMTGQEGLYADLLDAVTRYIDVGDEEELYLIKEVVRDERESYWWAHAVEIGDREDYVAVSIYGPVNFNVEEVGVTVNDD